MTVVFRSVRTVVTSALMTAVFVASAVAVAVGPASAATMAATATPTVPTTVPGTPAPFVEDVQPARAPFESFTAGTIRVGKRRLKVVVADSLGERVRGLRGRSDAAPYAGMLFVFPADATIPFTMSGVPDPLDITFFDRRGRRVDRIRMRPCTGSNASCPAYVADGPFRYSLETAPGAMPSGRLRVGRDG